MLRQVAVPASESICESLGSKMEQYHLRFTNSDDKHIILECRFDSVSSFSQLFSYISLIIEKVINHKEMSNIIPTASSLQLSSNMIIY